jgi:hypothetical protein
MKTQRVPRLLIVFLVLIYQNLQAQQAAKEEIKATEFSVPVSPAFALMGADPALVSMPGVLRDFKVDWSFRSYRLSPNISVEAQPIFLFAYDRPELTAYRKAGRFMRQLSTLSVSLGTLQLDTVRIVAYALKMNLFRSRDPLTDSSYMSQGMQEVLAQENALKQQMEEMKKGLDTITDTYQRIQTENQILNTESQIINMRANTRARVKELREMYLRSYWNSACIDLAFGQSYSYINESLDSLDLSRRGYGIWITGGIGAGKKTFFSGLVKYQKLTDTQTGQQYGINFRYGSNKFRFFTEAIYEKTEDKLVNELQEKFKVVNEGFIFAYGGDLKINNNVVLGFSLRTVYNSDLKFVNLIPVANIGCLMR